MNIIILGAGTVGSWIAKVLAEAEGGLLSEGHQVTLVDANLDHLRKVNEEMDVRIVPGSASEASTLFQAGVSAADLCLAVTGNDEVNLVAASMAKAMGARRVIARVYHPVFRDMSTFDYQQHFRINRLVSLEHLSAMELAQRIRNPGSIAVENFARGEIQVREIILQSGSRVLGIPLKDLGLPQGVIIGTIQRGEKIFLVGAQNELQEDDHVTVIGNSVDIETVIDRFQASRPSEQKVIIAGGGETGYHLARMLEDRHYSVVLMESNEEICEQLANRLKHTTVINCDATVQKNLEEEHVGAASVFVACTGEDENNIMACVEAKELGAKSVMSIVSRPDYANVLGKLGIDFAVSPRNVVAKQVEGYLTEDPILYRRHLGPDDDSSRSGVNLVELQVSPETAITTAPLAKLKLPPQCRIVALTRQGRSKVPGAEDQLQAGDIAVVLVDDQHALDALRLFVSNS